MDGACFHERADALLSELLEALEEADNDGTVEADLVEGVLTINIAKKGEYVINKHEPTRQVWVSSPESGASRFSYNEDEDEWYNSAGNSFKEFMAEEMMELADIDVEF